MENKCTKGPDSVLGETMTELPFTWTVSKWRARNVKSKKLICILSRKMNSRRQDISDICILPRNTQTENLWDHFWPIPNCKHLKDCFEVHANKLSFKQFIWRGLAFFI